ncbi:hypothetical protein [Microbispora siamensis]|uniref:Uncharacterized protein n=1 Tax=Microbispora siamensis TaxID=564413 RepID=A0ABQ4GY09_9ACTN|nr:hypothetical protein [Microbispora siamensis]GIH66327.1 hypothetical protein Msi02_71440 [Microbispora siamensis]
MATRWLDQIASPSLPPEVPLTAERAAGLLSAELSIGHGIATDVHAGHGVAFLSVWVDLLVWTNGRWFRWSTGRRSASGRLVFAFAPAHDIVTTARRVALLREELRRTHAYSRFIEDGGA